MRTESNVWNIHSFQAHLLRRLGVCEPGLHRGVLQHLPQTVLEPRGRVHGEELGLVLDQHFDVVLDGVLLEVL